MFHEAVAHQRRRDHIHRQHGSQPQRVGGADVRSLELTGVVDEDEAAEGWRHRREHLVHAIGSAHLLHVGKIEGHVGVVGMLDCGCATGDPDHVVARVAQQNADQPLAKIGRAHV